MNSVFLATVGQPLFGSIWLALLAVLGLVALLLLAVALAGRWLAATHPDSPKVAAPEPILAPGISPETLAIIASAVNVTVGPNARVRAVEVVPTPAPSVEALMLQWSLEGRRQIYTSHKVR
ncbi:MAG: hypothetical protein HZC55_12355 [Verrucomicrobia bacterium]|jgi:hypothetical protein|nr:hypothetical protein [Verrucomicrobiota bacterium]